MTLKITYKPLNLPLEFTFTISRGSMTEANTVIVEITHDGVTGIGEAVPSRFYGESQESVLAFYENIVKTGLLNDLDPFNMQEFEFRLSQFEGNKSAKAGLDMAMYDLQGKLLNMPLWKLWGLDPARAPKTTYTIGIAQPDEVKRKTEIALSRGYDVLKIKVGSPQDMETLKIIRAMAPEATIRVDANAAWTAVDALTMIPLLKEFDVEFVEEPLKLDCSPPDYEILAKQSPLPLMADESCRVLEDVPKCRRSFQSINIKLSKCGGLTEARRMISAARAQGLKIMLGGFVESRVSVSGFAQLSPLVDYADLDACLLVDADKDPYKGVEYNGSQIILPDRPGIGAILK